jgi:hypothetical protein
VHLFYFLGSVSLPGKERFNRCCYRIDKSDKIAAADVWDRLYVIGSVLLGSVVPQTDLILIVQPDLVIVAVAGIKNPLGEAFSNCSKVFFVGSAVWIGKIIQ